VNARKAIAVLIAVLANLGVFALPSGALADGPCPNEAIREEQNSIGLPECRAYEMVSPLDKNGGDIAAEATNITAAADGNGLAYLSRGSFGDTVGSQAIGLTQYLARRTTSGWSNHGITPMPKYDSQPAGVAVTALMDFSEDLSRVEVWALDLPGVAGTLPNTPNIYSEDTATRELQLVSQPLGPFSNPFERITWVFDFAAPTPAAVSHDARHIAFAAASHMLPEAPEGVRNVYRWDDGALRLASILPDGTPAPGGSQLASPTGGSKGYRETISPDGSRVLFTNGGQLYMRVDDSSTAWISEPEISSPPTPENVVLQQMTGDSRHVIFSTTSKLLAADPNEEGSDLYLYTDGPDPEHEPNLTLLTVTGDIPSTAVMGSSDDATSVYYYNNGSIFLWEEGLRTVVAENVTQINEDFQFAATVSTPGGARVTSDGRFLAFLTASDPTHNGTPLAAAGEHAEVYLYDAAAETLRCASCPPQGGPTADATVIPNATAVFPQIPILGLRPRYLGPDGKVYFSTAEPLVSADTNGTGDAYEFDPVSGRQILLSTGTGSTPSAFADASVSGGDVFIATRQQLVGADRDTLVDLYDVRVGGGFPEPPPPPAPCEGESCQPSQTSPPPPAAISSPQNGSGNVKGKRHHRRRHHCKKRHSHRKHCAKRKHHKRGEHKRAASADRRAAK